MPFRGAECVSSRTSLKAGPSTATQEAPSIGQEEEDSRCSHTLSAPRSGIVGRGVGGTGSDAIHRRALGPRPVSHRRHVLAVATDVDIVLDEPVTYGLSDVSSARAELS